MISRWKLSEGTKIKVMERGNGGKGEDFLIRNTSSCNLLTDFNKFRF